MKKIIFLLISILSLKTYSQNLNDRIFPKEGDSIICKITSVETNWIHYDHKGKKDIKNDYIHMVEAVRHLEINRNSLLVVMISFAFFLEFGKGRIGGKSGFTAVEWADFLNEKNYKTCEI